MSREVRNNELDVRDEKEIDVEYIGSNLAANLNEFTYRNCNIKALKCEYRTGIISLFLVDCKIQNLEITNSRIGRLVIREDSVIGNIIITSDLDPLKVYKGEEIRAEKENSISYFEVARSEVGLFQAELVYIERIIFKASRKIQSFKFADTLIGSFTVDQGAAPDLEISEFSLVDTKVQKSLELVRCKIGRLKTKNFITDDLYIEQSAIDKGKFDSATMQTMTLNGCDAEEIQVGLGKYGRIEIFGGSYEKLLFDPAEINSLYIGTPYRAFNDGPMTVQLLDLSERPRTQGAEYRLTDMFIDELKLVGFDNLGTFELLNSEVNTLNLALSRLRQATINGLKVNDIELSNAIISEARFANVIWPKGHLIDEASFMEVDNGEKSKSISNDKRKDLLTKLAEAYRQLKVVCLNGHDKINAMAFQRHELNQIWKLTHLSWKENFGNWLILGSNKLFSDFGQSLSRPLLWLFAVHSVWYFIICKHFSLGEAIVERCEKLSCDPYWDAFGLYWALLNPAHDHIVKGVDILGLFDFVMRLSAGFFIYYFLRATRKFNLNI